MYYNDHEPQHFHVRYSGQKALSAIETTVVLQRELSPRALGLVTEWAALHRAELMEDRALANIASIFYSKTVLREQSSLLPYSLFAVSSRRSMTPHASRRSVSTANPVPSFGPTEPTSTPTSSTDASPEFRRTN
jgi:hypothetical protein